MIRNRSASVATRSGTTIVGRSARYLILGATLLLSACGSDWKSGDPNVSVGGFVNGLNGGSVELWLNGGRNSVVMSADGRFTFPLQLASGSSFVAIVGSQPFGQTCTVTNGTGIADERVADITVSCVPYTYVQRPLPAVYGTAKAVNYSPYRTDTGPIDQEVPTDAQILEDLALLDGAGYSLLRLFGASAPATDVVAEKILRLAAANYPDMKFQLGISLAGLTNCSDPINDDNVFALITRLSKYPNVATISVGNETSFYSKYMPLACLENYIRTIRSQVTQPVTADDDFTFYAGLTFTGGDRVEQDPDTVLAMIDFASIHLYPISNPGWWNWQQTGVAAGPARAQAMMEAALAAAQYWYGQVASYQYVNAAGTTVTTGDSMPIVIGETGWKAVQTNPASEIEQYAALQPNAKWYLDLLYGNPSQGYASWEGSVGGPTSIFWFEATDERWKGFDDGWGLWDEDRVARYALCGTPVGPACNADLYVGAGYYNPPGFSTITFDSPSVTYTLTGFGGAEDSSVTTDPTGGTNNVARVNRSATAETYAGTVVSTAGGLTVGTIPFDASNTKMTVRVYSPAAGITVRLKVEDASDGARSVETDAVTTTANAWETLTFDFANPAVGPPLNFAYTYNRVAIFFNFGVAGSTAGAATYYFDDVAFAGGSGGGSTFDGTWASNYAQVDADTWTSVEGGEVGIYIDDSVPTQYWWNGVAPGDTPPSYYFGFGINSATKPWGFGTYVKAPGNGVVAVGAYANVTVALWGNPELMNTGPDIKVILRGPSISGCIAEVTGNIAVTASGPQSYTLPLSGFLMQTACGYATPADVLAAGIAEIHFQVLGDNVQYATPADGAGNYANGLNVGPITFN